jgi:hypothetical protein
MRPNGGDKVTERRLCLDCLDDWVAEGDAFCLACQIDRDRSQRGKLSSWRNPKPVAWYGPTQVDLDAGGFGGTEDHEGKHERLPWGFSYVD